MPKKPYRDYEVEIARWGIAITFLVIGVVLVVLFNLPSWVGYLSVIIGLIFASFGIGWGDKE